MKICVEDSFIYPLMKRKGTKLIIEADALIDMILEKTTNPRPVDVEKRIAEIKLNTRSDGTIQLVSTGGSDYLIGYKGKEDETN